MPRPIGLICLIAALSGPVLRQAEAAGDLARQIAELGDAGSAEKPDGGVGDEPESALLRVGISAPDPSLGVSGTPGLVGGFAMLPSRPRGMSGQFGRRADYLRERPPEPWSRRQAELGPFLF
jgi:hypothetical protein